MMTDMLTPRQFRAKFKNRYFGSDLAFAIGVNSPELMLEFNGEHETPEIPFLETLNKYGLEVKKVKSLQELNGKSGFILYGYYPFKTDSGIINCTYHVLRVTPDKSKCAHLDDGGLMRAIYEKPDEDGAIGGYSLFYGPMQIYELLKEKNINIDEIKKRMNLVFDRAKEVFKSSKIDEDNKSILMGELQNIESNLDQNKSMFSSQINILLEEVLDKIDKYEKIINPKER